MPTDPRSDEQPASGEIEQASELEDRGRIERELVAGFKEAGRTGLARAVGGADFTIWVRQESGWDPGKVSGATNQGMVNGGLLQFWFGHKWAQKYFSHGNSPRSRFTMPPKGQAMAVVEHFPHVTADDVHRWADQIRRGTYKGWG